uniref:t-SNARE coiled-coil homology domain-containing protein n=1 Tax=Meloidogyne hapla TaxID=6305 RepID=A0A1I8BWD8_MELHA
METISVIFSLSKVKPNSTVERRLEKDVIKELVEINQILERMCDKIDDLGNEMGKSFKRIEYRLDFISFLLFLMIVMMILDSQNKSNRSSQRRNHKE